MPHRSREGCNTLPRAFHGAGHARAGCTPTPPEEGDSLREIEMGKVEDPVNLFDYHAPADLQIVFLFSMTEYATTPGQFDEGNL